MKTLFLLLFTGLAAMHAHAYMPQFAMDQAPASLKGKRITFFYEGSLRFIVKKNGEYQYSAPEVTLRFVNFNYGNTSNGKNGGKMTYTRAINEHEGMPLTDEAYSGTGYRVKGNPTGDSGTWTLYFALDDTGSARYEGTENGQHVVYEDVYFKITPVGVDAQLGEDEARRSKRYDGPVPKSVAPRNMAGKMIVVDPKPGQNLADQAWALSHMVFGRQHVIGKTILNHMVACREFGETQMHQGNWRNALNGESEVVLFPGYFDYVCTSGRSARIQLSGESSANAYYILNFTTPTSGTLIFHHEDVSEDGTHMEVYAHIEDIPFHVEKAE